VLARNFFDYICAYNEDFSKCGKMRHALHLYSCATESWASNAENVRVTADMPRHLRLSDVRSIYTASDKIRSASYSTVCASDKMR
jgi:hypothetical protein